ncbi:NADPH-dependent 7-cyano-7-deazaguanine reductase QueF [bacterium]|nr:NADPH-dependent 7-cyano-7-deazaguanine reductase QueF [bacterium]
MKKLRNSDLIASTLLGKRIEGFTSYNPSILVAVPREENRIKYSINSDLPFDGYDVWHCYEFSSMSENGLPVTKVLKLKYPCTSKFIIESKSLKLYLNSFNLSRFGKNTKECLEICRQTIQKDLSEKLQTVVEVDFPKNDKVEIFNNFKNIIELIDENTLKIEKFNEAPEVLLASNESKITQHYLKFESLRSNCRITHQPDFGDVFIYYKSQKVINLQSLIKYLVSFRSENHFHEECVEMIYKRLSDILDVNDKLFVCAMYTRRGGIDITPVRYSKDLTLSEIDSLYDLKVFARNGIKQ